MGRGDGTMPVPGCIISPMRVSKTPRFAAVAALAVTAACSDNVAAPPESQQPGSNLVSVMEIQGRGNVQERFTAEVTVRGGFAYTSTWGTRSTAAGASAVGNAIKIWNVAADVPILLDSIIVPQAHTIGDIQVTDDGKYLVVAVDAEAGSIVIYDLANPAKPVFLSQFASADTGPGVHTAEIQRVNGVLYGFLCIETRAQTPARLVIVNLGNPSAPSQVFSAVMGQPYVHDVFVRDGLLFTALWNAGIEIFDVGGGGKGGTPANPVSMGKVATVGGQAHNIWWHHDANGSKKYAFVGQEGPGGIGAGSSSGDIHVIDVSNMSSPKEVAFFNVPGAGTHNFSMDEAKGLLYAAYYNAGVQVLDVRGDLGACTPEQKSADGRCDLRKMGRLKGTGLMNAGMPVFIWGVQVSGTNLYASDMLNGLWKLRGL